MATDNLQSTAPAIKSAAVTKSDATILTDTRGLLVGAAGTLIVHMSGDAAGDYRTITLAAGIIHPLTVDMVRTGGTATDVVAFW